MGLGGPEEDPQRHHCCWTGRVGEREEEEEYIILCSFLADITMKLLMIHRLI